MNVYSCWCGHQFGSTECLDYHASKLELDSAESSFRKPEVGEGSGRSAKQGHEERQAPQGEQGDEQA